MNHVEQHKPTEERMHIWSIFSNQFLDTETRTELPYAASLCVNAGWSVKEAQSIWCYEVAPVVWTNVWDTTGEWMGFGDSWLQEQIPKKRGHWPNRPGIVPYLIYRLRVHFIHRSWLGIKHLMEVLYQTPVDKRSVLSERLTRLAEIFIDFGRRSLGTMEAGEKAEWLKLFQETFLPIYREHIFPDGGESLAVCCQRVYDALETACPPPPSSHGETLL